MKCKCSRTWDSSIHFLHPQGFSCSCAELDINGCTPHLSATVLDRQVELGFLNPGVGRGGPHFLSTLPVPCAKSATASSSWIAPVSQALPRGFFFFFQILSFQVFPRPHPGLPRARPSSTSLWVFAREVTRAWAGKPLQREQDRDAFAKAQLCSIIKMGQFCL